MSARQKCNTCRYSEVSEYAEKRSRTCHRWPPQIHPGATITAKGEFALVYDYEWCGEWAEA